MDRDSCASHVTWTPQELLGLILWGSLGDAIACSMPRHTVVQKVGYILILVPLKETIVNAHLPSGS